MNKKWYEFWKSETSTTMPQLIVEDKIQKSENNILYDLQKEAQSFAINPSDIANVEMLSSIGTNNNLYYIETNADGRLSADTLKNLARHPIISSIIQTRVNQAAEFAQFSPDDDLGFRIVLRDSELEPNDADKLKIKELIQFIENCGNEVIDFELTFEQFIRQVIRDSLIYDQCCFEIVKNRVGEVTGFLPVDAATIKRSKITKEELAAGRRNADNIAFMQVIDNKVVAQFKQEDLCFGIRRPRTDVNTKKYGYPELEELIATMNNLQSAEIFNAGNFNNGISANGIIAVKSKMDPKLFRTFRREFYQMLTGVSNAKRTPLIQLDPEANEEISSINLGTSNREMEYNAWISYLIKTTCSVFQMDPAEVGFVYGSEGQGSSLIQADPATRVIMGKEKGLRPLIRSLQSWINKYIIWQIDDRFKLEFIGLDSLSVKDKIMIEEHRMKYMTLNEIRAMHDLQELENGNVVANYYGDALKANLALEMPLSELATKSIETIIKPCCDNPDCECDPEECNCNEPIEINKGKTYIATDEVAQEAARGLKAIEEHGSEAGTPVGRTRARQLANKQPLSFDTIKRMKAFFDRHEKNKEIPEGKQWYEDNGFVAWLLWGGDAGRQFAEKIIAENKRENNNEK